MLFLGGGVKGNVSQLALKRTQRRGRSPKDTCIFIITSHLPSAVLFTLPWLRPTPQSTEERCEGFSLRSVGSRSVGRRRSDGGAPSEDSLFPNAVCCFPYLPLPFHLPSSKLPQAVVVAGSDDLALWQHLLQQENDQPGTRDLGEGRHVQATQPPAKREGRNFTQDAQVLENSKIASKCLDTYLRFLSAARPPTVMRGQ